MSLSLPNSSLGTGVIDPTPIEENFTAISGKFGSIDNSDVASTAGIALSKLAGRYEHLLVTFNVPGTDLNSTGYKQYLPVYNPNSSEGQWTVMGVQWHILDTGDGAANVSVEWGYWTTNDAPTWTISTTVVNAQNIPRNSATSETQNQGTLTINTAALANDANPKSLALRVTTLGVGYGTTTPIAFTCSLLLRRDISST